MLTPKFLESVSDPAVALWRQVEDDILRDMARRISTYDYDIPSAMYQRQRLEAAGMLRKDVIKRLSRMTGKSQREIRRLMQLAGQETVKTDQEIYTRAQIYKASTVNTAALNRALQGGVIQTNGVMKNLCQTTATMAQKQFCNLLDRAWLQVSSGAFDIDSAVRNACKSLAASGIHAVQYSGRAMSLESAVRMIVRTGVNQTAAKLQLELAGEFETDLVQVTAHAGARPDHEVWQGKVFSISGKTKGYQKLSTATGYGTVEGLCGANCRHNFFPTWEGVDDVYPKELLEEYTRKDAYSYNGKKMSEYEATQVQRKIERNIRKWQREFITMEAAGQDTVEAGAKLKEWKSKERDFLKQTGLKGSVNTKFAASGVAMPEKMSIIGMNSIVSGARITNVYSKEARQHAERYYGLVRSMSTDAARIAKNTGFSETDVILVKKYLFTEFHDLGGKSPERFAPDFAIAESWQRLIDGKPEEHDLTLLKHEIRERQLVLRGMSQYDAHIAASKEFNYSRESDEFYATLEEHRNKK